MYSLLVVLLIILVTIHCKVSRPSLCYTTAIHFSLFYVGFHSGISQQDYRLYRIYTISVVITLLAGITFVLQRKAYYIYCLIINQSGSLYLFIFFLQCRLLLQQPSPKASKLSQMPTAVPHGLCSATSQSVLVEDVLTVCAGRVFMVLYVIKCNINPKCMTYNSSFSHEQKSNAISFGGCPYVYYTAT